MKGLVFRPGQPASLEEVGGFKGIQKLCGGFVERIVLDWGKGPSKRFIQMWVNEDGINQRLPVNLLAEGPSYEPAPIFGTAVLMAARRTMEDEEDLELTDEEVARWASAFKRALPRPPAPFVEEDES